MLEGWTQYDKINNHDIISFDLLGAGFETIYIRLRRILMLEGKKGWPLCKDYNHKLISTSITIKTLDIQKDEVSLTYYR